VQLVSDLLNYQFLQQLSLEEKQRIFLINRQDLQEVCQPLCLLR